MSVPAYAGERRLLVRSEPRDSGSDFLHLCLDPAAGPVRSWSIRTADGRRIAVQRVADHVAVAAVSADSRGGAGVTIVITPEVGDPVTFTR